jgi:hypothetical protein
MIRPLAAALALASTVAAFPARGDDVAEAKARFRRGVELYQERRWQEAIAEFEAAYRLKPHGAIHFNLAQCRERLDDWPGAVRSYQDYLREVPAAPDRATVRASIARIEERLAKAGVQVLLVYTDPPGARLALDGKERGTTPLHAALSPGSYALGLALEGFEPVKDQVEVGGAASRLVEVVLRPAARPVPAPPEPLAAPPPAPPDLAARPAAAPHAAPLVPPPPPRPRTKRATAAWVAAGTAVVAAAAGAYLGWSARQDADAIDALPGPDGPAASGKAQGAESKARAANALYALAGGAAAASLTLFVVEARF